MTIDERIEALTQRVKLLWELHQKGQKMYSRMSERLEKMEQSAEEMYRRSNRLL